MKEKKTILYSKLKQGLANYIIYLYICLMNESRLKPGRLREYA